MERVAILFCNLFGKLVGANSIQYNWDEKQAMTFIKIQNLVINTSYIAAVRLDEKTVSEEKSVSVLIATPNFSLLQQDTISENLYHYKWIEFTGEAATALQDYFTSFNNVIDLLPQYQESNVS